MNSVCEWLIETLKLDVVPTRLLWWYVWCWRRDFIFRYRLMFPYFALCFLRLPQMSQNEPWWEVKTSLAAIISEGSKLENSRSSEYQLMSECVFSPDCFTRRARGKSLAQADVVNTHAQSSRSWVDLHLLQNIVFKHTKRCWSFVLVYSCVNDFSSFKNSSCVLFLNLWVLQSQFCVSLCFAFIHV